MRRKQVGQDIVNVAWVIAATIFFVLLSSWVQTLSAALWGSQVEGMLLVWILPTLFECLVAATAGAALAYVLRTDHPVTYGLLFGAALVLWRWAWMTVGQNLGWQGFVLIAFNVLLPACVAAAVTIWLSRRRQTSALSWS